MEIKDKDKKKILEFHNLVVTGLVNGLTHTTGDKRIEDIEWVRKRLNLWESFGRTVFDFIIGLNDYSYSLKDLERIAKEGYTPKSSKEKS